MPTTATAKHRRVLAFGRVPSYRRYELFMERYRSAAELIKKNYQVGATTRFLDVGAGHGHMKQFFDADDGIWTGIEPWKERAKACRKRGYKVIDHDLDKSSLPLPDEHFDVVIASHVIEHLADSGAVVRDMARVLKPGGLMLVATPTKPPLFAGLTQIYHRLRYRKTGDTQNAFTARSLQRHLLNHLPAQRKRWNVIDCRGFRVMSARRQLPLEDWRWFYRGNLMAARMFPWLVPEVNVLLEKPAV